MQKEKIKEKIKENIKENIEEKIEENIKEIIQKEIYKRKGILLFDSDGSINKENLKKVLDNKEEQEGVLNTPDLSDLEILNIIEGKDEEIFCDIKDNKLIAFVPEELQKQIKFAVAYTFSEFDKVSEDINFLLTQFHIDRKGIIENAEITLKNSNLGVVMDDTTKQTIITCRQDVGNAIMQLAGSIRESIDYINNIPKDGMRRLFKVKVKSVLRKEKVARMSINEYVKGIGLYSKLSLKLGQPEWALDYLKRGVEFLDSYDTSKLDRMEGWNEAKDRFWINEINEYKELFLGLEERIKNNKSIQIRIGGN